MNICIISPKTFPVPAVKGGAVETLITGFVEENEVYKKLNIDLITRYDAKNISYEKKYKYTKFLNIDFRKSIFIKLLDKINTKNSYLQKAKNKIEKIIYNNNIIKFIKNRSYDFIITEGGSIFDYKKVYKYVDFNKSILHIHGITRGNKFIDENYKYFIGISNFVNKILSANSIISNDRIKLLYNRCENRKF